MNKVILFLLFVASCSGMGIFGRQNAATKDEHVKFSTHNETQNLDSEFNKNTNQADELIAKDVNDKKQQNSASTTVTASKPTVTTNKPTVIMTSDEPAVKP